MHGGVRDPLIKEIHGNATVGHSGILATYQRLKRSLYRYETKKIFLECEICQINKGENVSSPGLLQPLPVPGMEPCKYGFCGGKTLF